MGFFRITGEKENKSTTRKMKCRNISTDDHSLYINLNGICNKCQIVKDKKLEKRRKNERKEAIKK